MRGEMLQTNPRDGWLKICADEYPLGWGNNVAGKVKLYYQRGSRFVQDVPILGLISDAQSLG